MTIEGETKERNPEAQPVTSVDQKVRREIHSIITRTGKGEGEKRKIYCSVKQRQRETESRDRCTIRGR